jgi:hydrogenase nickel incorporation protein HypA/HybF
MHEMSIAQSLLEIILQESQTHQVMRVLSVALQVGELSAVETESLRFCFELVCQGTLVEGARLEIERVPVTCRCRDCNHEFTVEDLWFACHSCGSKDLDILSGKELRIESFEAE